MPHADRYAPISPEDVFDATAEARLRVAARRAAPQGANTLGSPSGPTPRSSRMNWAHSSKVHSFTKLRVANA